MIPLTPSFVIAAAAALVGLREEGGNNRGLLIEQFLRQVGQKPGQPWCAAFVHHVGYWSHYDTPAGQSSWPLPKTASCWQLGAFAELKEISRREPEPGDVFLIRNPVLARFAHTGVIVRVERKLPQPSGAVWYDCETIEGNTNEEGSREGNAVVRKVRRFYPEMGDRFVRWVWLDGRDRVGQNQAA